MPGAPPAPRPRASGGLLRAAASAALLLLACRGEAPAGLAPPSWQAGPAAPGDALVARVGGTEIRASEVARQARAAGQDARAALDDLIALELLAQEARRRAIPSDGEVELAVRQARVRKLLLAEFEPATTEDRMPDAAVRVLYDRARASYVRPPLPRFQSYSFVSRREDGRAGREAARARAERLLARLRASARWTAESFAALGKEPEFQEPNAVYVATLQTPEGPFLGEAARAIAALRAGEISGLLENDRGFHVVRVDEVLPARNISFEAARAELREGYYPRWRAQRFEELVRQAAERVGVTVASAIAGPVE